MRRKITKKVVDGILPTDHDTTCWDTSLAGFGVRCRPSGQKYYFLKTRFVGRQRWITLGKHGAPWTPESARKEAKRLIGEGAIGRDPAAARDSMKAAPTVAELGERFLSEYVPTHCKNSTAYEYRRAVELFINPALGKHKLPELIRADVSQFHHALREKPYQANRALGVLSKMMNMAEVWGVRPDGTNPCRHVKRYKEKKKERYLNAEELERLGKVLQDVEEDGSVFPPAVAAIRLLIFTGARLSEILDLRWEDIDVPRRVLNLPDSKSGAKPVYLNDAAIELLHKIPRHEGNPHVIVGAKPGARLVNLQKPWHKIRTKAGLTDVRIHDLRHSFASMAVSSGMSLPMIGALLGHSQPATTARYAHLADDPLRAAAGAIGASIAGAMAGNPDHG
jgi:integrase